MNQKSKTRTKQVWDRIRGKNPEKIFPSRDEKAQEKDWRERREYVERGPFGHFVGTQGALIEHCIYLFVRVIPSSLLDVLDHFPHIVGDRCPRSAHLCKRENDIQISLSTGLCFAWRRALFSVPMDMKASNKAEILAIWEAVKDFCFSFLSSFDCGGGDYEFWPHGKCYLSIEKSMSYEKITSWRVANPRRPIIQ